MPGSETSITAASSKLSNRSSTTGYAETFGKNHADSKNCYR